MEETNFILCILDESSPIRGSQRSTTVGVPPMDIADGSRTVTPTNTSSIFMNNKAFRKRPKSPGPATSPSDTLTPAFPPACKIEPNYVAGYGSWTESSAKTTHKRTDALLLGRLDGQQNDETSKQCSSPNRSPRRTKARCYGADADSESFESYLSDPHSADDEGGNRDSNKGKLSLKGRRCRPKTRNQTQRLLRVRSLLKYMPIFINLCLLVASLVLIMSGQLLNRNRALFFVCSTCPRFAPAPIFFGALLCFFTLFGFIWIRQRSIIFLLVYIGVLLLLIMILVVILIAAGVFYAMGNTDAATLWRDMTHKTYPNATVQDSSPPTAAYPAVYADPDSIKAGGGITGFYHNESTLKHRDRFTSASKGSLTSPVCQYQEENHCVGYRLNCTDCYDPKTYLPLFPFHDNLSWCQDFCPNCSTNQIKDFLEHKHICTDLPITNTLGGFLVACAYSLTLTSAAVVLAVMGRGLSKMATALDAEPHEDCNQGALARERYAFMPLSSRDARETD